MARDTIVLLGVNHKTTPLAVREKMALASGYDQPLADLRRLDCLDECFLLSTCNRVEVLFTCNDPDSARRQVLDMLFAGSVSREEVVGCIYQHRDEEAVRHLFLVASSLDSMIVGESQILGQLKEAYRFASEKKTSGMVLNKLLHKSFSVAKRVRTETKIGASAVSISYAAVELGKKIFGDLKGKRVMLVGAGEMAELAAEHLVGQGVAEVIVANRTFERAVKLAGCYHGRAIGLEELVEQLQDVDIIVSSTGAPDLILTREDVAPVMPKRRYQPLFFIDIAVPRDLDPAINEIDNVYLYDIDDLNNVVEMNKSERDKEAVKASRIVEEETLKFCGWLENMEVTPTIIEMRSMADQICRDELGRTLGRLGSLTDKEKKTLEKMASSICSKMLHHPIRYLKTDHPCVDQQKRVEVIRTLFNLDRDGSERS